MDRVYKIQHYNASRQEIFSQAQMTPARQGARVKKFEEVATASKIACQASFFNAEKNTEGNTRR